MNPSRRPVGRPRPIVWCAFGMLIFLSLAMPAAAQDASRSPTLSVGDRLEDRRYVATGTRAYVVGTQEGRFPAMGFHTRGEMGGIWSPPIKLLDGLWFGINDELDRAGHPLHQRLRAREDEAARARRAQGVPARTSCRTAGAPSSSASPSTPATRQKTLHPQDGRPLRADGRLPVGRDEPVPERATTGPTRSRSRASNLVFRERGTPPADNALRARLGGGRGVEASPRGRSETDRATADPRAPPVICPPSPRRGAGALRRHHLRRGQGRPAPLPDRAPGQLDPDRLVRRGGADLDAERPPARRPTGRQTPRSPSRRPSSQNPGALLRDKIDERLALRENTRLDIPGHRRLQYSIDWSKQNLADSVQIAEDLEVRETNAGENYPPPEGTLPEAQVPRAPGSRTTSGSSARTASTPRSQASGVGPVRAHKGPPAGAQGRSAR